MSFLDALTSGNLLQKKALLFRWVGYRVYAPEVKAFHESQAHMRIVSAPARTSKSYSAFFDALGFIFPDLEPEARRPIGPALRLGWIVAPDYKTSKEWDYAWDTLVDRREQNRFGYTLERAVNNPTQGNMEIRIHWGKGPDGNPRRSVVECKSATSERSLQGEQVYWAIMSEAAEQEERILSQYLATRVTRSIVLPTTPKLKAEWIYKRILDSETYPDLGIEHFTYTPHANPEYDWENYRREEKRAALRSRGIASKDPWFAEQFLGQWTFASERTFPFRERLGPNGEASHIMGELPFWFETAPRYVATDYGYSDRAAAGWYAVGPDETVVLYKELYEQKLSAEAFVRKIRERSHGERIRWFLGDPKKPEVTALLRQHGLPIWEGNRKKLADRAAGFMRLADYLEDDPATGRPKLYFLSSCDNAIREFKSFRFKGGNKDEFAWQAYKGADHLVDCTRAILLAGMASDPFHPASNSFEQARQIALRERGSRMPVVHSVGSRAPLRRWA